MLAKRKSRLSLLLVLLLVVALTFSSCSALMTVIAKDELQECRTFFDYVNRNSYAAAYDSLKDVATPEQFDALWQDARNALAGAQSYTLSVEDWTTETIDGEFFTAVMLLLTTDAGKSSLVYAFFLDGEWLCYMGVEDITPFAKATSWVPTANLVLTILSLLGFAFSIWMFVDSLLRRIRLKALWAILTFVSLGAGITVGASQAKLLFNVWLLYPNSTATIDYDALSFTVRVLLPVGAIVYFFLRRRLTVKDTPAPTVAAPFDPQTAFAPAAPEATAEAAQEATPAATEEAAPETAADTAPETPAEAATGAPAETDTENPATPAQTE